MAEPYRISALKYRPALFADVVAQEHITRTLQHSIEKEQTANAYIFAGPRGTGKTTTARILAKALNCTNPVNKEPCNECVNCKGVARGNHPDVMEIDAASNRQVDEAEALRETTQFSPSLGQYKIYIIDECHMLTNHANNALLKTLEEPPSHVKFIFATTELNKILPTIKSRCQLFQFRRIPTGIIVDRLKEVLKQEASFVLEDQSELERILYLIAQSSEGGMRDALVSLDQLMAFCSESLNLSQVEEMLGVVEFDRLHRFVSAMINHDLDIILQVIEDITNRGREIKWFMMECQQYLRNLMVVHISPKQSDLVDLVDLPEDYIKQMKALAAQTSVEQILYISDQLWEAERRMYFSPEARMIIEIAAIKAAKAGQASNIKVLLQQLASSGNVQLEEPSTLMKTPKPVTAPQPEEPAQTREEPKPTAESSTKSNQPKDQLSTPSQPAVKSKPEPKPVPEEIREDEISAHEPPPEKITHDTQDSQDSQNIEDIEVPTTSEPRNAAAKDEVHLTDEMWAEILAELEEINTVFAHCLDHSELSVFKDGVLAIRVNVPDKIHMNAIEKAGNRKQLEELVHNYCGKPVRIKFEIQTAAQQAEEQDHSADSNENQLSRGELMERLEKTEQFQHLQEILPGKIVQIHPLPAAKDGSIT